MDREWSFDVECSTMPGEVVCLTGSCPELGGWAVNGLVRMKVTVNDDDDNDDDDANFNKATRTENVWHATVTIPDGVEVSYRYCVVVFVVPNGGDKAKPVVRRWETNILPRKIGCHEVCGPESTVSRFGYISGDDGYHVHGGWLTHETVVQLKLQGSKAVNIWKAKHAGKRLYVKITPVETSEANLTSGGDPELDESLSETRNRKQQWPIVEVGKLNESECHFRPQPQFGTEYVDDDFVIFRAQMLDMHTVAFLVDIYARPKSYNADFENEPAEHIGSCYLMPNHLKSSEGQIQTTVVSKRFHPIGQLNTCYSVVHPMKNGTECDFSVSYANYWKPHWKGLDVGHRGLGNSYTKRESCATVRENTIGSMKNAALHGADMVEFDVQLSHDLVPVVYHDFELLASIVNKKGDQQMMVQMPLKNLTLDQLQQLKTFHPSEKSAGPKTFQQETDDDHQPFPTLELVLNTIDEHVGFNIELKWDMEHLDGSRQSHNAFEMNLFVDTVMKTVMEHAGPRKIVFSSFNPDVCYAIRLKQNRYPVLFLTQGMHSQYDDYLDPRTRTVANAAYFAAMAEILGVNPIAEDLLRDPSLVPLVKERFKLVLFCWTDDKNDPVTVKRLKQLGLDGVIYDRMDCNNEKEVKESVFMIDLQHLKQQQQPQHHHKSSNCSCSPSSTSGASSPGFSSLLSGASIITSDPCSPEYSSPLSAESSPPPHAVQSPTSSEDVEASSRHLEGFNSDSGLASDSF